MSATKALPTNEEIAGHELFTRDDQAMCRAMRTESRKAKREFTLLDFAKIALRATGLNYTNAEEDNERAMADHELRRTAILYVYEALRACDQAIITEWDGFDEMLRSLVTLAQGSLP